MGVIMAVKATMKMSEELVKMKATDESGVAEEER
jgi:hypothetical protein